MEERKDEICEGCEVHEDLLKIVNETLPEETELYDLAELFKVFGDSTRIRILFVLFEAEVCVCDLAKVLNMTQSAISHQLRILKQNKLVKNRREGKSIFYSLADDHVRTIINQGRDHIEEDWLLFTRHYPARCFGMRMPKSRDIPREFMRIA